MNIFVDCANMDGVVDVQALRHVADLNVDGISLSIDPSSHLLNCTFTDCKFSDSMSGVYTDRTKFVRCTFHNVSFVGCDFIGCEFIDCEFYNCKSVGSTTVQQDMDVLFTVVEIPVDDDDTHSIVSGTRYVTEF